jgi:hypothetical protein
MDQTLNRRPEEISVPPQRSFDIDDQGLTFSFGLLVWSWCAPFHGVGDFEHHPHAMTATAADFAEPLGHYRRKKSSP